MSPLVPPALGERRPARLALALGALAALGTAVLLAGPVEGLLRAPAATGDYDPERLVLLHATLPRLAMAVLCGGTLGLSGAILQQVLRNPLASPTTVGIDAGARLALTLATLFAPSLLGLGLGRDAVALAGAAASTALVFALTRRQRFAPVPLVLAGLVVTLYCGALSAMLTLLDSRYLVSLFIWGGGSLSQQSWEPAGWLLLKLAILAPLVLPLLRPLRLLDLGEDGARALGLPVARLRVLAVALALSLAALVTTAVGVIGFVGLVAPLLARLAGARDFGARLAWSAAIGALLLLLTDLAVQLAAGAYADLLPTGAVTAVLGSPILLWLLPRLSLGAAPPPLPPPMAAPPRRFAANPRQAGIAALAAFAGLIVLALLLGRAPDGSWSWLAPDRWGEVLPWRLPRVAASMAAGALLGIAGLALQRLTGNEMASPEVLGVSAGATLAVALALFGSLALSPAGVLLAAGLGALAVLLAILALGGRSGLSPERVLLAGVSVSALLDALVGVLSATGDPRAIVLLSMMGGSTGGVSAADAWRTLALALAFAGASLLCARWLAILPLGAPGARALGVNVARGRLALLLVVAGASAAATTIVGPLTFAGLMAPHIVRMLGIHRPAASLAAAALAGAAILVSADWVARTLAFPFQLPTGILAALVGAPFLLWLLQTRRAS